MDFKEWFLNESVEEVKEVGYGSHCPICGGEAVQWCRCSLSDTACENNHQWHRCPVHKTMAIGSGHGSNGSCTCQKITESQVGWNSTCPICGEPPEWTCKCDMADAGCKNKHQWHECPVHQTMVIGPSNHGPGEKCFCGRKNPYA